MDIHEIINRIYRMPETSVEKVVKHLSKVTYPKGHHILEAGKTETNIFFIEKGITRAYIPVDGKEVTFWIGKEGSTIVSLKSYVNNQQGYESMELGVVSIKAQRLTRIIQGRYPYCQLGAQVCRIRVPANRGKTYFSLIHHRVRTVYEADTK